MDTVLVPVDFSRDSITALRMADYEAKLWNARLVLVYVERRDIVRVPVVDNPLAAVCDEIRHTPTRRISLIHCAGRPAEAILEIARQFKVRAIFMGHGSHSVQPGPVAFEVKVRSEVPVEIFSETMAAYLADAA